MHLPHPHDEPAPPFDAVLPADYVRWRPGYHLVADRGWMNDPCGPGYNPSSGLYHAGFQWNPKSAEWGDILWGKAFSEDMVEWEVSDEPSMERDEPYDCEGVFTGSWFPTGLDGRHVQTPDTGGQVSFVYTSVSHGPIHYTKPYHRGCETLSVATSKDGGQTWVKHPGNPILPGPPESVDVTGWRDPYVAAWPAMQKLNWEVTNFLPLQSADSQYEQEFLILGAEGCAAPYGGAGTLPGTKRTARAQLWIALEPAHPSPSAHGALMDISYGGILDHGLYYAANSFFDPLLGHHVALGWVTEEDLPVQLQINQGWSGCLSLPRVISLQTIANVVRASASALQEIASIRAVPVAGHAEVFTVQTLGVAPDPRLQKLRRTATRRSLPCCALNWSSKSRISSNTLPLSTAHWEGRAVFSSVSASERVGLAIHHADGSRSRTLLSFRPDTETLSIDRPPIYFPPSYKGSKAIDGSLQRESGPLTLFTTRDPHTGQEAEERLEMSVFYDGSVVEVYVNGRAALTTRVYLDRMQCAALEVFVEGENQGGARLEEAVVWDGLSSTAGARESNGCSHAEL